MTASRSIPDPARHALLDSLQRQVERLEGQKSPAEERLVSTGSPPLDRLLPGGGLRRGSLVEYLSPAAGSGAGTLALAAAREACRHEEEQRAFVVIDRGRTFYPPAAAAWGIDLSQTILVHPADSAAELWALDQALRCPGVGAVYAVCGRLDVRDFRRLQLAAESGGALGVLVRPSRERGQPTWADVQWQLCRVHERSEMHRAPCGPVHFARGGLMHPTRWRLSVQLLRCRGGSAGQIVELELDETTGIWQGARVSDEAAHPVSAPAQLADPARPRRA